MKVGLFLNTQFQPGQNVAAQLPDLIAQTRAARDAGFKSLWFPHHYLTGPLQMLQIVPMMAYLAPHAEGMQIGPNILVLPLLNPVHVAEESATLDVLTGGNYVLGVGLGYREGEFTAFGMSLKERARGWPADPIRRRRGGSDQARRTARRRMDDRAEHDAR